VFSKQTINKILNIDYAQCHIISETLKTMDIKQCPLTLRIAQLLSMTVTQ